MTYYRNQRMEAFKRAMFAGLLDRSPVGESREPRNASREESTPAQLPELWGAQPFGGALVH